MLLLKLKNLFYVTRPPLIIGCLVIYLTYIMNINQKIEYKNYQRCFPLMVSVAFANVINNYFDYEMDKKFKTEENILWNRDALTKKDYFYFSIFLFLSSLILNYNLENTNLMIVGIYELFHALFYSCYAKKTKFKNVIFLCLLVFPIMLECVLENYQIFQSLLYSIGIFLIYFPREIILDINDYEGDKKFNLKTIPILIGKKNAFKISKLFHFFWICIQYINYQYNFNSNYDLIFDISMYLYILISSFLTLNTVKYGYDLKKIYGIYFSKILIDTLIPEWLSFSIHYIVLIYAMFFVI